MESKSRTTVHPGGVCTWSWSHHPGVNNLPPFFAHPTEFAQPDYDELSESIADTQRSRRNGIDDNDCDHIKSVCKRSELPCSFILNGESNDPGSYYTVQTNDPSWAYYAYGNPWGIDGITGVGGLPSSGDSLSVQDYIDRSIRTMLPGIKPKLSILNSIYELKDFKSLPKLLNQTLSRARSFAKLLKTGSSNLCLRQLVKLTSSHYLNYSFNLRSLVSDVMSCQKAWQSVGKQIKSLLDNEGKIRIRHYAEAYPLIADSDESYHIGGDTYTYDGHDLRRVVNVLESSMFRATLVYQYWFSDSQRRNANLYGALDSLGIQLNPAIIWNAIPWSFVVDWVIGVSQFLDQFKEGNLTPTTNILRYCWSVKAARRITNYVNYCVGGPGPSGNVVAITTDQYVYYRRKHQPDWIQWFSTTGLNLKEFTYIGALIGSR